MSDENPVLLICDGISWRLDLFGQALQRVYAYVAAFDAKVEVAYRTRDDLALVVVRPGLPTDPGFRAALVFEARLPGFRVFEVAGEGDQARTVARNSSEQADVVVRVPTSAEAIAVLRGRLGMLSDARAAIRLRMNCPVRYSDGERWVEASTNDLTAFGVFVRTPSPPPVDTTLELELFATSSRGPLTVTARVVRLTPAGFGARIEVPVGKQDEFYRRIRHYRLPPAASAAALEGLGPVEVPSSPPASTIGPTTGPAAPPPVADESVAPSVPSTGAPHVHSLIHAIADALSRPTARALVAIGDDERRQAVCSAVQRVGFETLRATTLDETLTVLLDELLALDAVVVDHVLRGEPAEQLLFRVRQTGGETHLPIVVLSDHAFGGDLLLKAGADLVLRSSATPAEIADAVQSLLTRRREEALG